MGMKCDCRADISSKVGVNWREGRRWSVRGREFGEERVGGFGCDFERDFESVSGVVS